jgi:hypothetical protein
MLYPPYLHHLKKRLDADNAELLEYNHLELVVRDIG